MDCPKCGVAQDDEREDCVSCGIVFARFREAQERAMLRRSTQSNVQFTESPADGVRVSGWLIFAAALFFTIFGVMWTKYRRDAAAKRDLRKEGMALVNEANNRGVKERQRLEKEREQIESMGNAMTRTPKPVQRPVNLDETQVATLLEQCFGFNEPSKITLPKNYYGTAASYDDYRETYPALGAAFRFRVVEKVGNEPKLWPGPGAPGLGMMDRGEQYEIDLGVRRVREVTKLEGDVDHARAEYRWTYQNRAAAELLMPDNRFTGVASLINNGGAWRVERASLSRDDGTSAPACKEL